jgi:hypothetical protein
VVTWLNICSCNGASCTGQRGTFASYVVYRGYLSDSRDNVVTAVIRLWTGLRIGMVKLKVSLWTP